MTDAWTGGSYPQGGRPEYAMGVHKILATWRPNQTGVTCVRTKASDRHDREQDSKTRAL